MKSVFVSGLLGAVLLSAAAAGCNRAKPAPAVKISRATLESMIREAGTAEPDLTYLDKLDTKLQELLIASLSGDDIAETARTLGLHVSGRGNVLVDVYVNSSVDEAAAQLRLLGMDVRAINEAGRIVEGPLPIQQLQAAARLEATRAIMAAKAFGTDSFQ